MSSVSNLGANHAQVAQKALPKSWPKVTDGATPSGAVPLPQDGVQLTAVSAPGAEQSATPLIPIAISLEIPTNGIGGLFTAIPVLLSKGQAEDPNWQPKAGTSLSAAPVLDAHVSFDAPLGQRPVAVPIQDLPRDQMPVEKHNEPLLLSEKGRLREEREWQTTMRETFLQGQITNGRTFITLTLGVDEQGLQDFGDKELVFAPDSKIDHETKTWKNSEDGFILPKFVSANFLDEDEDDTTAPVVEYLMVDETMAEADFPLAIEHARDARTRKTDSMEADWQGEKVNFDVEVTDRFEKVLKASPNLNFDPKTGALQETGSDGKVREMSLSLTPDLQKRVGDAAELPPWLLKPKGIKSLALPKNRVVVDIDPLTRQPTASCPDGYVFAGAVKPEVDKVYSVEAQTPSGPRTVNVRFDERAAGVLNVTGTTFSKSHALLYARDGTKIPLDSRNHQEQDPQSLLLRQAFGLRPALTDSAPPWTTERFVTTRQAVYGVPKYGLEIQLGENASPKVVRLGQDGKPLDKAVDDSHGLETGYKTFRDNREQKVLSIINGHSDFQGTSDYVPVTEKRVNERLLIRAPSQKLAQQAERLSKLFLGSGKEQETVDLAAFNKFRKSNGKEEGFESAEELTAHMQAISESPKVRKELAALLGQEWSSQSMQDLVEDAKRGLQRNSPVELTVVPKGADVSHYLNDAEKKARKGARTEMAAFVAAPQIELAAGGSEIPPTRVFVAEEYFETPEKRAVVAHELLHAYMDVYASKEDHDSVDKAYEQSLAGDRAFPCLYGALQQEFVPTLGEEFMGLHGSDGPAWVKKEQPEVYQMLQRLTGFDPVGGKPVEL